MGFSGRKLNTTTYTAMFTLLMMFTAVLLLTACGGGAYDTSVQTGIITATPTAPGQSPAEGQARLDAQATLAAVALVEQQQTAVAQAATVQAVATVQAQQTAVAQATQAAQATISAEGTAVAAAIVATEERRVADEHALMVQATQAAIDQQANQAALQATLDASLIADQQERMVMQREAELARLEYERMWNYTLRPMLVVVGTFIMAAFVMFLLYGAWRYINYRLNPVHAVPATQPGVQLLVNPNFTSFKQLQAPPVAALPAPPEPAPEMTTAVQRDQLPQPRWEAMVMFMKRGDGSLVPFGVDRRNRPIIIDWSLDPHLSIAGSTRRGKTATGMVTYIAGLLSGGVHVILVNGKGADFKHLEGHQNLTVVPRPRDDYAQVTAVTRIVNALNDEMSIRDRILYETGAATWKDVPAHKQHAGPICVAIDEFLSILDAAADMAADPRIRRDDRQEAVELEGQVMDMWRVLKKLTSEGAKYGLLFVASFTDPRKGNLGPYGMRVLSQMTRVAFGMNNGSLSQSYLALEAGSDFPRGSAGLPPGEFLIKVQGVVRHGRGFYPKAHDIKGLYTAVRVSPTKLPDTVLSAIRSAGRREADWGDTRQTQAIPAQEWPQANTRPSRAEQDATLLDILATTGDVTSLNQIALFITGSDADRASGEDYERAAKALAWRIQHKQCPWATAVVKNSRSQHMDAAKELIR
jgi:hypothetical protein